MRRRNKYASACAVPASAEIWLASTSAAQRRQQTPFAQLRLAPAAYQLQRLHQEFDLADAARTALDVVGQFLARDFGADGRLHRTQAVERAVIEVTPVHNGRNDSRKCSPAAMSPATGRAFCQA